MKTIAETLRHQHGSNRGSKFAALKAAEKAADPNRSRREPAAPSQQIQPTTIRNAESGIKGARFAALKAAEAKNNISAAAIQAQVESQSRGDKGSKFAALREADAKAEREQHEANPGSSFEKEHLSQQNPDASDGGKERGAKFAALRAAEEGRPIGR